MFSDSSLVYEGVLSSSSFTEEQQDYIYHDEYYGMNSTRKLVMWVTAADGDEKEKLEA